MKLFIRLAQFWLLFCPTVVWAICTVNVIPVSFGVYDTMAPLPLDSTGAVNVSCDVGVPYIIRLDQGVNSAGAYFPRKQRDASSINSMNYNLFLDPPLTKVWGDGTGATFTVNNVGTGAVQINTVYGRVEALQNIPIGVYSDNIVITVEW